jgi:hypothetical protein
VQGVSGVAKDLAKMSSKSAVKLLAPAENGGLFKWVALLTGSKNAVKGLGFFLGAALLALVGFQAAIWGMAAVLALILIAVILFLPAGLPGRVKAEDAWGGWRSSDPRVNRLSPARGMSGLSSACRSISRWSCPTARPKADVRRSS